MRKLLLLFSLVLFASPQLSAQNRQVSGTVTGPDGSPVAGVTVVVTDTNTATITTPDGSYSINAPADASLEFSFLGMVSQSVPVQGRSIVNVQLDTDTQVIDDVVVTALGITRSEKSLGYSVTEVASNTFEEGRESNILNSLSGKVAGVNVMQNSGTAGGGSKIVLRGQSSLNSSSQPLFVVDGVPINNSSYIHNDGNNGAVDTGSRIGDVAGDDIESMNVLKGAAATALYGARAKDGVIIITTKKGTKNQKLAVSVNSSFRFDSALKLPDYQNEYGPGIPQTGEYSMSNWNGWGPKITGQEVTVFTGEKVALQAYPDNVKDFFNGGATFANSISMSGGDEKNDFRLGISSTNQKGIVPENEYNRYNFTFNGGRQFNNWFSGRVSASYITATSEGRAAQGSNDMNVVLPNVIGMPRTMNTQWLADNWIDENGSPIPLGNGGLASTNNPYWVLNKNKYTSDLDRLIGSVYLELKPVEGLTISNNLGVDVFYDNSRRVWAKETLGVPKGRFETVNWNSSTLNNDFIAVYDADLGGDFSLKVMGGMNMLQITTKTLTVDARSLLMPDIYSYANAEVKTPTNTYNQRRLVGVYGEAGLSWRDMAYLTVTGRNDWSSTMPASHKSYFYPSVSGSFIFSELLNNRDVISFGKVRANFAMVGSDTDPYALSATYSPASTYFRQYIGTGKIPHGGLLAYNPTGNTYPSPELQPQMKTEYEFGADLGFFKQRLRLGVTYYYNLTKNNIARFDTPNSTGYFYYRKNAGEITNEGLEITLGGSPFRGDFNWDIDLNFATNTQKVKSLDKGMTAYGLTSGYNGLQIMAAVGEAFSLYGLAWDRDPEGNIVIDEASGLRKTSSVKSLGKITPDFTLGINNSFSWKGVGLSFLVDIKQGGVMYSQTAGDMLTSGLGAATLLNDRQPIVDKGVNRVGEGDTATYKPNTTEVKAYDYWTRNFTSTNSEGLIFDASYVKLREVIAGYTLPDKWLGKFPIKNIFIGFEARNLWIIHSNVPNIDPELNFFSTGDIGYGVEFAGVPSTRSLGFNIKFNF